MLCAVCGYGSEWHELGTNRCPPETADKNGRRGSWREPAAVVEVTWREVIELDAAARRAAFEEANRPYVPPPPPMIPARPPLGAHEYATSTRGMSAVKLGRKAIAAGWDVSPWYWMAYDWREGCAIRMAKGTMRAVATWGRPNASSKWTTDLAYAWRSNVSRVPTKMTHTQLEGLIR